MAGGEARTGALEPAIPTLEAGIAEAQKLMMLTRYQQAEKSPRDLQARFPNNRFVERELASVLSMILPPLEALAVIRELIAAFPADVNGPILEARVQLDMGRAHAALESLDAAARLGAPQDSIDDLKHEALEVASRPNALDPPTDGPHSLAAIRAGFATAPPRNSEAIERSLDILRAAGERLVNLALTRAAWYGAIRMNTEAASGLKEALVRDPNSMMLKELTARYLYRSGQRDEAARYWTEILQADPENAQAHSGMVFVALTKGQFRLAWKRLGVIFRSDHFNDWVKSRLRAR